MAKYFEVAVLARLEGHSQYKSRELNVSPYCRARECKNRFIV